MEGWKKGPLGTCSQCSNTNGGWLNPLFLVPAALAIAYVSLRKFLTFKREKRLKAFGGASRMFADIDTDKDGKITREELARAISVIPGLDASDETVVRLIETVDLDHSGDLDEHEFFAWLEHSQGKLSMSMVVLKIVVGLGQVVGKQPKVLGNPELEGLFEGAEWLSVFAFDFGWLVPVCTVDYSSKFLLNTVVLPTTLLSLVALTWKMNSEDRHAGSEAATDADDFDEARQSRRADYYFAFFLCCKFKSAFSQTLSFSAI